MSQGLGHKITSSVRYRSCETERDGTSEKPNLSAPKINNRVQVYTFFGVPNG